MTSLSDQLILKMLREASNPIALPAGFPVAACFKNLNLVEIPRVMREQRLFKGAALMEHWFLAQPFVMPGNWKSAPPNTIDPRTISPQNVEESIITMEWALRFGRVVAAHAELKRAVLGFAGADSLQLSKDELFDCLSKDGKFGKKTTRFGLGSARMLQKTAHLNLRKVATNTWAKLTDPLDDMYCALGVFAVHAVASGTVTPLVDKSGGATHQVKIEKIGFYIKDTYDFNDDQPLGLWDGDGVSRIPGPGRVLVENKHFRLWRTRFRRGGDFMLFSDIHWEGLPQPILWQFTVQS